MRAITRNPLKITGMILLSLLLLCAAFTAGLYGYNRYMLSAEASQMQQRGQYVEVDGGRMNIYTEGSGNKTLVFLAGANTPAAVWDFKPLYSILSDTYQTVVIEKFGYGYSDDTEGERTLGIILEQDRKALQKAGLAAPYILCPHSASGLEAVRWAQLYPDEVEAIIGLDMAVPEQFDHQTGDLHSAVPQTLEETRSDEAFFNFWLYDMGGYRLYNFEKTFPASASPGLTERERAEYKAVTYKWYSRFHQTAMYREGILTQQQLRDFTALHDSPVPDIPTLLFVSSDEDMFRMMLGENGLHTWREIHEHYAAAVSNGQLVQLDCGHSVHAEAPDAVSAAVRTFINDLQ